MKSGGVYVFRDMEERGGETAETQNGTSNNNNEDWGNIRLRIKSFQIASILTLVEAVWTSDGWY